MTTNMRVGGGISCKFGFIFEVICHKNNSLKISNPILDDFIMYYNDDIIYP